MMMINSCGGHTDLTVCGGPVRLYRAGDSDPALLLACPKQIYTGARTRDFIPINQR